MTSKFEKMHHELKNLINKGQHLYYSLANELDLLSAEVKEDLIEKQIKLPSFLNEYDIWYSESIIVIKQLLPDRLTDFIMQYKDEKRKNIIAKTYCISDYLHGIAITRYGQSAFYKMQNQISIMLAAEKRFQSTLFDIKEILQADLFDSELSAARELIKKGFIRGGGVIAGVVLEKHLSHVCEMHNIKFRKNKPTISDYYNDLKKDEIIDVPNWRYIQRLGDLRNLCCHNDHKEPTTDDVNELIEGVEKVIKTIW